MSIQFSRCPSWCPSWCQSFSLLDCICILKLKSYPSNHFLFPSISPDCHLLSLPLFPCVSTWESVNPLPIFSFTWMVLTMAYCFSISCAPILNLSFVPGSCSFQEFPVLRILSTVSTVFPANGHFLFFFLMSVNPKLTLTIDPLPPWLSSYICPLIKRSHFIKAKYRIPSKNRSKIFSSLIFITLQQRKTHSYWKIQNKKASPKYFFSFKLQ